nr:MAG TPA: hypothetical protein [Caudoviricetes sp.]
MTLSGWSHVVHVDWDNWRHVLGVPPFFMPSACRVVLASNIIVINQTRKGKRNDYPRI